MNRRTAVLALLVLVPWIVPDVHAADGRTAAAEISHLLDRQAAAWNQGDLDAFCSVYADDALFASPSGLTRGREEVLRRYRESYPDRAAMGTLTLEVIEVRELGKAGASVVAHWKLAHEGADDAEGLTLLTFERADAGWRIVHDASFSASAGSE